MAAPRLGRRILARRATHSQAGSAGK